MRKLSYKDIKDLAQSHTAKWKNEDLSSLTQVCMLLTSVLHASPTEGLGKVLENEEREEEGEYSVHS